MSTVITWESRHPSQTLEMGAALGQVVTAGTVLALCGPLGSGKTQLVKGLARGLSVPTHEPVVSPTFVLVREYVGRHKLYHIDAYRLGDAEELALLGLDEMWSEPGAIVAIEWADRCFDAIPSSAVWFELAHAGPTLRHVALAGPTGTAPAFVAALDRVAQRCGG